jgi:FKBP-type peptidyl-prolyl cis-trans isomerase
MKKLFAVGLAVLALSAQAQKTTPKKTTTPAKKTTAKTTTSKTATSQTGVLKTLNDSASYAIGISVASFYTQQGMKNINASLVSKAISDVVNKKPTLINESQCNDVIMTLMNRAQQDKTKPNIEAGETFLANNKNNPAIKTTASGLQYEVITPGNGPHPLATDTVTVNYKGSLIDGTEFDNSYSRGEPLVIQLNRVIPGWTEGVQLMPVGSKYKFYIPYQLGYGLNGTGPIPGGSVLIFEVELLKINGK